MKRTLIVSCGENDGTSLVPNKTFSYSCLTEMLRDRSAVLLKDSIEIKDLDSQCVASSSRLQLVHFDEHRLSKSRFCTRTRTRTRTRTATLLFNPCLCRHWVDLMWYDFPNPNCNIDPKWIFILNYYSVRQPGKRQKEESFK